MYIYFKFKSYILKSKNLVHKGVDFYIYNVTLYINCVWLLLPAHTVSVTFSYLPELFDMKALMKSMYALQGLFTRAFRLSHCCFCKPINQSINIYLYQTTRAHSS